MKRLLGVMAGLALGFAAGCAHKQIAGTTIEDTPDNQAIIEVLRQYKAAFEARDAAAIVKLASPKFYETNGTPDPADDYDYTGLSKTLDEQFKQVQSTALDLDIRKIEVVGEDAAVNVYFASRFQMADAGPQGGFKRADDVAQIRLHKEDGGWKITSGI